MNEAQRRRDAALRRLRLTNRGGLLASVAGTLVLIGLAHHATPVGASRRGASQVVTHTVSTSGSHTRRAAPPRTHARRKIRPAEAPTTVATNVQGATSATTLSQSAPVTTAANPQSSPSPTQSASTASAGSSVSAPTAPVTSGGS